ncbi:hypothetical protein [Paraburkholderia aromaticivorans]|nr:hypothetical protein [Paraburkholderia aromaticivorans]
MKRDDTLAKAILKALEDSDREYLTANKLRDTLSGGDETKHDAITHHVRILDDRGLVEVFDHGKVRLTWDGHDALEPKSTFFG